jgi:Tfp pilus assembly protein PilN
MNLQNINLLPDIYIEKKIPFSGQQTLQLNIALLLIFGILLLGQYWSYYKLQKKTLVLNVSEQNAKNQLNNFITSNKKPEIDNKIQERINAIKSTLMQNKQLNEQMSHLLSDQQQGFSVYLEALAAQHVEGIWLSTIDIADDGKRLIIHGSTIDPSRVPEYLEKLKDEHIFQGRVFDDISFDRDIQNTKIVNFVLTIGKADDKVAKQ